MIARAASLSQALDLGRGDFVAFVGGGGKTTAILKAASELRSAGLSVLATTTTRVGPSIAAALAVVELSSERLEERIAETLLQNGAAFLAAGRDAAGKFLGVDPSLLDRLAASDIAHVVLVEADGSRQKPLKAPAAHEPVIPSGVSIVVPMVGLDALGRTIDEDAVHRPELVAAVSRADRVTAETIVRIVVSREGGLKGVPPGVVVRPVLNKVAPGSADAAVEIASAILERTERTVDRVLVTDIRTDEFAFLERR